MKALILAAACAALMACGQPAAQQDSPAPPAPAAATSAPDAPAPADLVGRWGDNGDCSKDIVFAADGTFRSYTGGSGTWTLQGDVMSMTGANGTFQVRVAIINNDTLMIGNADGSYGLSRRC